MGGWRAVFRRKPVIDCNHIKAGIHSKTCSHDLVTIQRPEHEAAAVKVQDGATGCPARLSAIPIKPQPDRMSGARFKHRVFGYHAGW